MCLRLGVFILFLHYQKVSEIEVVGLSQVPAELVQEKDGIVKGKSIWTILANRTRTATLFKSCQSKIKDASIELVAWNKIRLNIEENPAIGYFKTEEKHLNFLLMVKQSKWKQLFLQKNIQN